jgi:TolB-like protein/Flp pilus assembly protein TadD
VVGITVLAGVLFAGVRSLLRRRPETSQDKAPSAAAEPAPAAETSPPDLDPLTVPGFEGRPAIAVLPFDNLSGDPDQEYFADGIAEDLITRLSAWRWFPVIARNSSFTYRGEAVDVKRVSRELGVRYVVEGSVRKAGDRVRISAQLIDATTGAHVWAQIYDRELRDVFALQDEITEAIAAAMYPELERRERERAERSKPQDLEAWECVMRGWWHWRRSTKEDNEIARSLFQRAIQLDSHSSNAYAYLAVAHSQAIMLQFTEPQESISEMVHTAKKSVELDPNNAVAQIALCNAFRLTGKQQEGIRAAERAVELNPSYAWGYTHLGMSLAMADRAEEAIPVLEKALRLDPSGDVSWQACQGMVLAHFSAKRYEQAIEWAQRVIQENAASSATWRMLAASHAYLGQMDEAHTAFAEVLRLQPSASVADVERNLSAANPEFRDRYIDALRKAGLPG